MKKLVLFVALLGSPAIAQQQPDPTKLAPLYRQQREMANDAVAACSATVLDLQAKITELEKKLGEKEKKE